MGSIIKELKIQRKSITECGNYCDRVQWEQRHAHLPKLRVLGRTTE